MLPEFLDQIPPGREIGNVTADSADDTHKCHDAIIGSVGDVIMLPRKNARPWKAITESAVARNDALRASKRVGRTIWRGWGGYHRRSHAKTKMHCVKLKGWHTMARDFDRQVVEFRVRVAVLNGFTAIGGRSKLSSQPIGSPLGSWAAVSPSRSVKAKNRGSRSPAGWQISGDRPIPTPLRGHRRIVDLRFVPALSRHSTPR